MEKWEKGKKEKRKGGGEQHAAMNMNSLPDCVLQSIMCLLPLKDAARASLVCTRWRSLWTCAPLCIDDSSLHHQPFPFASPSHNVRCCQAVLDVISKHHGPVWSCRLTRFDHPLYHEAVGYLLRILQDKHIQQLSLSFSSLYSKTAYLLPYAFLSCTTLFKLTLYFCCLPKIKILSPPIFPKIKDILLTSVSLDDTFLTHLLSCPCLEKLHLCKCTGYLLILVSSPNLIELVVTYQPGLFKHVKEATIQTAPNLNRFVLGETATTATVVKIKHAPKLTQLGFLCLDPVELQIAGHTFKRQSGSTDIVLCGPRTVMSSVKSLAVRVNFSDEKQILLMSSILKCFPFLETLDVKFVDCMTANETSMESFWVRGGPFSFLNHLKRVTLKGFSEHRAVVNFANFLILNALVLEEIALLCSTIDLCYKKNWVEERCLVLRYNKRASPLKIKFSEDWGLHPKFASWNLALD